MLPFSRLIDYGNTVIVPDGFIEMIPDSTLSYAFYQDIVGSTNSVSKRTNFRSYRFRHMGTELIIPSQPLRSVSYKEVYEGGMMYGTDDYGTAIMDSTVLPTLQNKIVQLYDGSMYRVRLMRGSPDITYSEVSSNDTPNFVPSTEYELLTYGIYSNLTSGTGYTGIGYEVPSQYQIAWTRIYSSGTRRWTLVQGTNGVSTSTKVIGRGRWDAALAGYVFSQMAGSSLGPLLSTVQNVWWPVLEKI